MVQDLQALSGSGLTVVLVALSLSVSHSASRAQESVTSFRTTSDLVAVDVTVLDAARRPVMGLTASDFTVLEDGVERRISAFASVSLPTRAATPVELGDWPVRETIVTNSRSDRGRLVAIVMDRSIPSGQGTVVARTVAKAAVDALAPGDLAAIVQASGFSGEGGVVNLTADKQLLVATLDAPMMGLVSPPEMTAGGLVKASPELLRTGDCVCGLCSLEALERVATAMGGGEGAFQKSILFIGSDLPVQERAGGGECSLLLKDARTRLFKALDRGNIRVHAIDPSGLQSLSSGADYGYNSRGSVASLLARHGNLAVLPEFTGGRSVVNTNAPERVIRDIFDETGSFYLLGFQRTDQRAVEDRRRNIQVRVGRRGVTVRHRRGYYSGAEVTAPAADAADPSAAAITGLLPRRDLLLALGLVPTLFKEGVTLILRCDPVDVGSVSSRLASTTASGSMRLLDVTVGVFDSRAKHLGSQRQMVEAAPSGDRSGAGVLEWRSNLALAPGRYEIRVGVADRNSGKTGSVYGYVEVPDTRAIALSLSGVSIEAAVRSEAGSLGRPRSEPSSATLRRTFGRSETLAVFVQVHQRGAGEARVRLRTRISGDNDRTVSDVTNTIEPSAFNAAGVANVRSDLSLSELQPGRYLLTIEVSDGQNIERREVPFSVK